LIKHCLDAFAARGRVGKIVHDGTGGKEGGFKVVDQVSRVLNTDTKTDEVLGKTAFGADGSGNGGVAGWF
jgi:hypothetical protein